MALLDITGQKFGRLTVLSLDHTDGAHTYWRCKCDCGNECICRSDQLRSKTRPTSSCGCLQQEKAIEANRKPMVGSRFGKATVISLAYVGKGTQREAFWNCRCDCGNVFVCRGSSLRTHKTKSCPDCAAKTHGLSYDDLYGVHQGMIKRTNPKNAAEFPTYAGMGVSICKEWYDPSKTPEQRYKEGNIEFMNFYHWAMSSGYEKGLWIERKDPKGNYCPENCTWKTPTEQQLNKRESQFISDNEEILNWSTFVCKYGCDRNFVKNRVDHGWSLNAIAFAAKEKKHHNRSIRKIKHSERHKYIDGIDYVEDFIDNITGKRETLGVLIPRIPDQPNVKKHKKKKPDKISFLAGDYE